MLERYILIWSSRTIFNNLSDHKKISFRKLEVKTDIYTELHLKFNLIQISVKYEGVPGFIINISFQRHDCDKHLSLIINLCFY